MPSNPILDNLLQELTHGRPFIFIIMRFKSKYPLYNEIRRWAEDDLGLACVRADDVKSAGYDLLEKIHFLIEKAELVVAEISEKGENVYYEIGYASGIRKTILILAETGTDVPADLKGKELINYDTSYDGMQSLHSAFCAHVRTSLSSRISLLREMLLGDYPNPSYIIASPKYPGAESRILGQVYDTVTFGDNLGIVGLLSAFGTVLGELAKIELVSAHHCDPNILSKDCNLYVIGSKKSNRYSGEIMEMMIKGREPRFYLGSLPVESEVNDYQVFLYAIENGKTDVIQGICEQRGPAGGLVYTTDYGVVVRGPHPIHPHRRVVFLAGPHSLGSGGACLAATRSTLIQQIRDALPDKSSFSDPMKTIWALVKAQANSAGMLEESGVSILRAGVYS